MIRTAIRERRYDSILAILFVLAFFLPMLSKTYFYNENHIRYPSLETDVIVKEGVKYKVFIETIHPYKIAKKDLQARLDLHLVAIIAVTVFAWPLLLILIDVKLKNKIVKTFIKYIELLFYLGSLYVITVIVIMKFWFLETTKWDDLTIHVGGVLVALFLFGYALNLIYRVMMDIYQLFKLLKIKITTA